MPAGSAQGKQKDILLQAEYTALTLARLCNGPWRGQTPNHIRTLLSLGYPPEKLKCYHGGMQDWHSLGLTTF